MTTYTYILTQPWPIGGVLVPAGLVVVPGATSPGPSLQGPFPDLFDYIDALGLLSSGSSAICSGSGCRDLSGSVRRVDGLWLPALADAAAACASA